MTGAMFYVRFVLVLSMGLVGLSMVLVRLLDTIFAEWDVVEDIKAMAARPRSRRGEPRLDVAEAGEPEKPLLVTRLQNFSQGREPAAEPYEPPPFPEALPEPAGEAVGAAR